MYSNKLDSELREETKYGKKLLLWVIGVVFVVGIIAWIGHRSEKVLDTAFINYEEFQEIYNTTQKINSDLATIREVPDSDSMFANFSKAALIAQKRQNLARWVEEYNAKSKMWNRAMWKSDSLPYQLNVDEFSRYNK